MAVRSILALICAATLAACAPAEAAPGSREAFRDAFAQRAETAMPGMKIEALDGATLRITAKLRQLLANAVERKAVQRLIERIIAANADLPTDRQDLGALLGQAADALLTDGWPLHALAPVLRVTARQGLAPEDMPHAARAILNDAEKSHTARGRILEHEEAALFAAARTSGLGGGGDIWLLP